MSDATPYFTRKPWSRTELSDRAILTPPELYAPLNDLYHFDNDPCPWPRPDGFDGLTAPWGRENFVNPLFWGGGLTAWVRRALAERKLGNGSVLTLPLDRWVCLLLDAANEGVVSFTPRRDWSFLTPGGERRKSSHPIVVFRLKP